MLLIFYSRAVYFSLVLCPISSYAMILPSYKVFTFCGVIITYLKNIFHIIWQLSEMHNTDNANEVHVNRERGIRTHVTS